MIKLLHHPAPRSGTDRTLLVMLPGAGIDASAFAEQGLVQALQVREPAVDVIAAQPALDLYLDGSVADVLHRSIIEPALAQGYSRFWFLGISLGGMGALLYASGYACHVEGLFLLAPFLGTQGTVAEIAEAGGFASWSAPGSIATTTEGRMLVWLQDFLKSGARDPALYLGYGDADRFAQGHRMLGEKLPYDCVVTEAGGHDWDTWRLLWRRMLETVPCEGFAG